MTTRKELREIAHNRRKLIKKIIIERGFTGIIELRRILREEYDIDVKSRETLYNDMEYLGGISQKDFDAFSKKLVSSSQYHLNELNRIIEGAADDKTKVAAIKVYYQCAKDYADIMNRLRIRDKFDSFTGKPMDGDDGTIIRFKDDEEDEK